METLELLVIGFFLIVGIFLFIETPHADIPDPCCDQINRMMQKGTVSLDPPGMMVWNPETKTFDCKCKETAPPDPETK